MLKEDAYKEIVGKFEEKFNGFIDVIKKSEEKRLSQPVIKPLSSSMQEVQDFFINRYKDIPEYVSKIFNIINNSQLNKIILDEDIDNLKVISNGEQSYDIVNNKNERLFLLTFRGLVRKEFDKPESDYKFSCSTSYLDLKNKDKSKIIGFYKNKFQNIYRKEDLLKYAHSLLIVKSYAKKLNLQPVFLLESNVTDINEIDLKDDEIKTTVDIKVNLFQDEYKYLSNNDLINGEYFFELFKEKFIEKLNINNLEEFNDFLVDIQNINKYMKSLKLKATKIDYNSVFYPVSKKDKERNPCIIITEFFNNNKIKFVIYPEKRGTLRELAECDIYTIKDAESEYELAYSDMGSRISNFKFKDFVKNKEEVLEYLYLMKY